MPLRLTLMVCACAAIAALAPAAAFADFGFNEFVFVDGTFVGTISPVHMASRADGPGDVRTIGHKDSLITSYARYAPTDPLCCPSSTTIVWYRIDRSGDAPVLVPE